MQLYRRAQVTARDNHRMWFIRQGGSHFRLHCARCNEPIQMITLEEAAVAASVEVQTIHSLIAAGKLHCAETVEAVSLVCLNSLIAFRRDSERAEP